MKPLLKTLSLLALMAGLTLSGAALASDTGKHRDGVFKHHHKQQVHRGRGHRHGLRHGVRTRDVRGDRRFDRLSKRHFARRDLHRRHFARDDHRHAAKRHFARRHGFRHGLVDDRRHKKAKLHDPRHERLAKLRKKQRLRLRQARDGFNHSPARRLEDRGHAFFRRE